MQFRITFRLKQPGQMLPLSYQYELSSWVYKLISSANSAFGEFLHSKGYVSGKKRFKLFTFSSLYIPPKYEILGDRVKIYSNEVSFVISFLVQQAAQDLVMGLFQSQELRLGDRISQMDLTVERVEMLPKPAIPVNGPVRLKATSPIMVSQPEIRDDGKLHHKYLHPADKAYEEYFIKNLREKYQTALKHQLIEPSDIGRPLLFRLLSPNPKKRGIRIRAFTPAETQVIGYMYDFELTAPPELIRLGLLAGFGGENALGFGATRLV